MASKLSRLRVKIEEPVVPDSNRISVHLPEAVVQEIWQEAARLDRSVSWIMQHAWRVARDRVREFPSARAIAS